MTPLQIDQISAGRYAVIGELDMATAETLREALRPIALSHRPIALDLGELTFIDSSGIRALVDLASRMNGSGPLMLFNLSVGVRRLLDIVGLDNVPGIQVEHGRTAAPDGH